MSCCFGVCRFVFDIIEDLSDERKISCEGLFRVSGSAARVKADVVSIPSIPYCCISTISNAMHFLTHADIISVISCSPLSSAVRIVKPRFDVLESHACHDACIMGCL